jgi:hypothetical protein
MAFPRSNLGIAMERWMFGRAERLELLPGRSEEYFILQDERLIEKAQNYDEATRAGKVVKRRHPGAKVEIQFSGVVVELK